ncbi:CDHR2-like protein [Mya arenaria]|uniref:CDHR2-like protein n=1 Tax=Mya arenaria TaxID=6604 RepID=A0ABY7DUT0_MYAAR|nr:CDHR2-like protein [Mya arenaria]
MTGSGFLLISVQPNALPTSIPVDTVIYVVDVRDDEQLTLRLTCDPSPCPFALNNDGEVRVTSDFPKAQTDFLWTFTADDSFVSVTSPTVNVAITGINTPPTFVYLNNSAVVAEKSPIGLTDIKLLAIIDSNELNSVTVTFTPALCANMFFLPDSLTSSNVLVLNVLSELDYETDPTYCTLHVTLFDGLFTSDPCVLTVEIIDVDENPVWTDSAYVQTLTEVTSGTTVFTSRYGASDPEGTNVSYSISCGTDSGFLSVEKHAVVVTMATTFDLDAAGVEHYKMVCNLTATDAESNMAAIPFTLRIEDANDNYPVFKKGSYTFEIYQGNKSIGSEVGKVTATDADISSPNNELTFSVSPTTDFYITGDAIIHSKSE